MKSYIKTIVIIPFFLLGITLGFSQTGTSADQIVGTYHFVRAGEEMHIKIYKTTNGNYSGRIIWLRDLYDANGNIRYDDKNPDPKLRKIPGNQVLLFKNLQYNEKTKAWEKGDIYDPRKGRWFGAKIKPISSPNEIIIRGYVLGIPAIGEDYTLTRLGKV